MIKVVATAYCDPRGAPTATQITRESIFEEGMTGVRTFVETGMSPLTMRYRFGSKYFGKSSASSELVAGRSSETLTQTAFPAAIAPAWRKTR